MKLDSRRPKKGKVVDKNDIATEMIKYFDKTGKED